MPGKLDIIHRQIEKGSYRTTYLNFDNVRVKIPSKEESRFILVGKIAISMITLGIAPLFYIIGKKSFKTMRMVLNGIKDGGEIIVKDERDNERKVEDIKKILKSPHNEDPYFDLADRLRRMQLLSNSIISFLSDRLNDKKINPSLKGSLVAGIPNIEQLKAAKDQKNIIIPLVIKGGIFKRGFYSRDHITTLIVNFKNHEILFLDPKGNTLHDYRNSRADHGFGGNAKKIPEIWNELITNLKEAEKDNDDTQSYQPWYLKENIKTYQKDAYNCGVHFYHIAEAYAKNGSSPYFLEDKDSIRNKREEIINEILNTAHSRKAWKELRVLSPQDEKSLPAEDNDFIVM